MKRRERRQKNRAVVPIIVLVLLFAVAAFAVLALRISRDRQAKTDPVPPSICDAPAPTLAPDAAKPAPDIMPTFEPEAFAPPSPIEGFPPNGVCLSDKHKNALPYGIYVSKNSFTIAILGIDEEGKYTRCLRTFRTAIGTGNKTRAGKYTILEKYDWYPFSDTAYTPYTVRCTDKMRIHGPLHGETNFKTMHRTDNYGEIGQAVTAGCLRTTCAAAAWIYYNCPVDTPIRIANDAEYTSEEPPPRKSGTRYDPTNPAIDNRFEIPVSYFSVNAEILRLSPGETWQLAVGEVLPADNTSDGFLFASAQEDVATVDQDGLITAHAPGIAHMLVQSKDVNGAYRRVDVVVSDVA